MPLNLSESHKKEEMHEKRVHSRAWHFKAFPKLTLDDIQFELTPDSIKLFERGKPGQGFLGLGELTPDGKIKLHLLPGFDIKESDDPDVKNIGDRPELVRRPIKPEAPTKKQQSDKDFMEKYNVQMMEWKDKHEQRQAYLKKDKEWMAKWKAWAEKTKNFVDKNGVPYATKEYVETGDANVTGNTGIGHKRMVRKLGLEEKAGIESQLIGFGIWKGKNHVLSAFADRSLSQNANSVLWHDQFFKQYVFNGMELYGVANQKILKGLIDKMKLPAFVICANPPRKYIIDQNKKILDCGASIDERIIERLKRHEKKLNKGEKNQLISYEKFSNLKAMVELSDKSLKELGLPSFIERTKQQQAIKDEILFSRARSLPWALSEMMLTTLLENLPVTPTKGKKPLPRKLKFDKRSYLMTSPIFDAVKKGELEEMQKWIEGGCSPEEVGCTKDEYNELGTLPKNGLGLIDVAYKCKKRTIFQYLYQHPKFNKEKYYIDLLHDAVKDDDTEIQDCLLGNMHQADADGNTPLHLAAKNGEIKLLKWLLDRKANIAAKNKQERTALHLAAIYGYSIVSEMLLKSNADTASIDKNGQTSLHLAVMNGRVDIVKLLAHRAPELIAMKDKKGRIPLDLATNEEIIQLLILETQNQAILRFTWGKPAIKDQEEVEESRCCRSMCVLM